MLDNLSLDDNNNEPRIISKLQLFFYLTLKELEIGFYQIVYSININRRYRHGRTLLHAAVSYREIKIVSTLLNHIDKDEKDDDGVTPLHLAAHFGNKEIVALLIAYKADINAKDNYGITAVHRAACNNKNESADVLSIIIAGYFNFDTI